MALFRPKGETKIALPPPPPLRWPGTLPSLPLITMRDGDLNKLKLQMKMMISD